MRKIRVWISSSARSFVDHSGRLPPLSRLRWHVSSFQLDSDSHFRKPTGETLASCLFRQFASSFLSRAVNPVRKNEGSFPLGLKRASVVAPDSSKGPLSPLFPQAWPDLLYLSQTWLNEEHLHCNRE